MNDIKKLIKDIVEMILFNDNHFFTAKQIIEPIDEKLDLLLYALYKESSSTIERRNIIIFMHLIDKKKYCILINAITNNIYDSMEKEITMSILEDGNNNTIFNIIHDLHVVIHSYKKYEEELDKNAK